MSEDNGFMRHDDLDYVPGVPNPQKRQPERVGKPRAAQHDDIASAMSRIVDDIIARDGPNLRYRGRGR